ncbi:MAG: 4a-hydroxytetrahydrobiopterin dehydratase [Pelolinea sp.]|nr:4a-hydroxytetrahydrobiopterin dehydratase [Pelolinea sp.]
MALLAELKCTVCQADDIPMDDAEIREKSQTLPGWSVKDESGVKKLSRVFKFKDYLSALDFTQRVGLLAEEEGHHPALVTEWGKVTVVWWTHKISGLHENDFIMAAKTDRLFTA